MVSPLAPADDDDHHGRGAKAPEAVAFRFSEFNRPGGGGGGRGYMPPAQLRQSTTTLAFEAFLEGAGLDRSFDPKLAAVGITDGEALCDPEICDDDTLRMKVGMT